MPDESVRPPSRRVRWLGYLGLATAAALVIRLALFDVRQELPLHGHGYCYLWEPTLVSAHVAADVAIGLAYVAIAATLWSLVRRTHGALPYSWMFLAFGTFIVACGLTHFMEVWTLWTPVFWLSADLKIITALASVATAVMLPPLVPRVLTLLDDARLSRERETALVDARADLEQRVAQRTAELRQALAREQELRHGAEAVARTQEEFLRVVSHELRTPLNAIVGWSEVLLQDEPSGMQARGLRAIARNAQSQTQLVNDLIDASALDLGKLQLTRESVDARAVTGAATEVVRFALQARRQHLDSSCLADDGPLLVHADPARLRQVLVNLLSNASKFTPEDGQIRIELRREGGMVVWRVSDTGEGMSAEFLERAFERFAQANASTTREHGGLGLGLSIAHHLVTMHDGTIEAASDGPGQGATFTVRIPAMLTPL